MKLRNKKTGEIVTFISIEELHDDELEFTHINASGHENALSYSSLKKLNEEWEEYNPKEPLIKDEKIRKAVKVWAEANGFNADYYEFNIKTLPAGTRFSVGHYDIEFIGFFIYELQTENSYTLAELCGEEEE